MKQTQGTPHSEMRINADTDVIGEVKDLYSSGARLAGKPNFGEMSPPGTWDPAEIADFMRMANFSLPQRASESETYEEYQEYRELEI